MSSLEQTPCEKCYGGYYGRPHYKEDVTTGYMQDGLVYVCDVAEESYRLCPRHKSKWREREHSELRKFVRATK